MILAAVQAGGRLTVLAVIAVLNAAAAAFYYLRVVVYMFMRDPESDAPPLSHGALLWGGLAAATGPDDPARARPDPAAAVAEGAAAPISTSQLALGAGSALEPAGERGQPATHLVAPPRRGRRGSSDSVGAGRPVPWTAMVTPGAARRARGHHRLEGVDVAHLVPEETTAPALARDQPLDRLTLAAGVARAKIDDRPTAVVARARGARPRRRLHAVDRIDDRGARRGDVVGLANVEGHGRSLAFDEQPRRRPKLGCDAGRERLGRGAVRSKAGSVA